MFGYTWLMWETKKALHTQLLRKYPAASGHSICVWALGRSQSVWVCSSKQSVSVCALGSTVWPNCNKERLLLHHQIPYLQLSPSLLIFSEKKESQNLRPGTTVISAVCDCHYWVISSSHWRQLWNPHCPSLCQYVGFCLSRVCHWL
jgi:hypothetical protein